MDFGVDSGVDHRDDNGVDAQVDTRGVSWWCVSLRYKYFNEL